MESTWPPEPDPSMRPGDASMPSASTVAPSQGPAFPSGSAAAFAPAPAPPGEPRSFVFTATGGAYFRIWIVNLLLTIVTIGFYSPWAKVRRLRYFYGNTTFDGSPFEFHGRPMALFKGRLIGLVLLIAYTQAAKFSLMLWVGVVVILVACMPWLLWKSLRFRLANSSYRGIHFGFDGTIGQAYLTFVPLMLMFLAPTLATLLAQGSLVAPKPEDALRFVGRLYLGFAGAALFAPWFYFRLRAYQHRNARLGTTPFAFDGRVRSAYWIAFKLLLLGLGFVLIASLSVFAVLGLYDLMRIPVSGKVPRAVSVAIAAGAAYLLFISGLSQPLAMIQNFVWNHSTLGGARFTSAVGRTRLWWIMIVNLVLSLITLGLFWPFAVVRTMRYRIGSVTWAGDSAALLVGDVASVGATGEETADLFGLDIAL